MGIGLIVNGEPRSADDGTTAADLLAALGLAQDGVAIAIDDAVHPRSQWDAPLPDGATIEILTAVQGG